MTARARRVDAIDNRARIVAAARASLTETDSGLDTVNLHRIAQTAGVGQATLYRHFPSREHLITEVYRDEMTDLVSAVPTLLTVHKPLEALTLWLERVIDYARVKMGVIAAIETATWQDLYATEHLRLDRALEALLEQGRRNGDVRADVDATDVVLLLGALSRMPSSNWDCRARVLVAVIIDGLRAS